jgi:DNA-binding NarL/FixJ family response regulator
VSAIRVLLADDQHLVRAGFRLILENDPDVEVVAEAATGAEAVELSIRHRPDVVLMDVRMPDGDGVEATRRIVAEPSLHRTRVVMLTTFELDEHITDAIDAGASGFLLKDIEPDDLRSAVRAVAGGAASLSPSVTATVLRQLRDHARRPKGVDRLAALTARELDVVALVGRGMVNAEIARELHISAATVKTHVARAMAKLHARDRAALVVLAHETGLVAR